MIERFCSFTVEKFLFMLLLMFVILCLDTFISTEVSFGVNRNLVSMDTFFS